jgi:hypothetical protein
VPQYPGDARRVAEELLGRDQGGTDAEIFTLTETTDDDLDSLDGEPVEATPVEPPPVDADPVDVEAVADESTDASTED